MTESKQDISRKLWVLVRLCAAFVSLLCLLICLSYDGTGHPRGNWLGMAEPCSFIEYLQHDVLFYSWIIVFFGWPIWAPVCSLILIMIIGWMRRE